MSIRNKLLYKLVHVLSISNKEAQHLIHANAVIVNKNVTNDNIVLSPYDTIELITGEIVYTPTFEYYKLYKPVGIECTLSNIIENNLLPFLPHPNLFPVGRLDKASEGLLLLTNDAFIYDIITRSHTVVKTYTVNVNQLLNKEHIEMLSKPMEIMGKQTLASHVIKSADTEFIIELKQGLNRQIRRMCYKLQLEVLSLKRTQIHTLQLENLGIGEINKCSVLEINELQKLYKLQKKSE